MSFVQVRERASSSSVGLGDRTPFYGAKLPEEIKKLVKLAKSVDHATVRKVLKLVVRSCEEDAVDTSALLSLATENLSEETVRQIFAGLRLIITLALRQPSLKAEFFQEDLIQLKLKSEMVTDLNSAVFGSRQARLHQSATECGVKLPCIDSLRWRVDVTISTSSLNRVLEPCILMEMTLSDGTISTFEVPVSKFHDLRYNVSYVLKEMGDLEKRNILKVQN